MLSIHAKWSNGGVDGGVSFSFEELNRGLKIEVDLFRNTWRGDVSHCMSFAILMFDVCYICWVQGDAFFRKSEDFVGQMCCAQGSRHRIPSKKSQSSSVPGPVFKWCVPYM